MNKYWNLKTKKRYHCGLDMNDIVLWTQFDPDLVRACPDTSLV